jgi:hypothetical protein
MIDYDDNKTKSFTDRGALKRTGPIGTDVSHVDATAKDTFYQNWAQDRFI